MYRDSFDDGDKVALTLSHHPRARAAIRGSAQYPAIRGEVRFHETPRGVLVVAEISGLPQAVGSCESPVFGFHIHEGGACTGNRTDPFFDTGTHYNPGGCPHPYHAGDLPPLFGANGYAVLAVLTDRFSVDEVIGRAVVIHSRPDDFKTQPSGDAGEKIACGVIVE